MTARILLQKHEPVEVRKDETVLAAMRRRGLAALPVCDDGCCRSCLLRTDAEIPAEAQAGLTDDLRMGGAFLACQLRPTEDLPVLLPDERPAAAVLVLAGGHGSRIGGEKDQVLLRDGRPMLHHVLDVVRTLGLPVRLSTSQNPTKIQLASGLELLPDTTPYEGPLAAVAHGLELCPEDGLLVVCCDQPLLQGALLARLLPTDPSRFPALFEPLGGGGAFPFPGYYPRSQLAAMRVSLAAGERSPRHWAARRPCIRIPIPPDEEATIRSFNSMEDLRTAGLSPGETNP